ncbi:MAG: hypothetical protein BGP25_12450 [Lysobacterales bacterium 63-13]|nr:MAG: hypothetical protein BGP25_12450 [Xanthomonadales bacterium 63-13]
MAKRAHQDISIQLGGRPALRSTEHNNDANDSGVSLVRLPTGETFASGKLSQSPKEMDWSDAAG